MDAAVYGARAAYIGGAVGTATVLAGQMFNIPISGTMAHSWVMFYRDEFEAFKHYAENYPDATVLLVDRYARSPLSRRMPLRRLPIGSSTSFAHLMALGIPDLTTS